MEFGGKEKLKYIYKYIYTHVMLPKQTSTGFFFLSQLNHHHACDHTYKYILKHSTTKNNLNIFHHALTRDHDNIYICSAAPGGGAYKMIDR